MATVAAVLVCGVMAYRAPGFVYEVADQRPVPPVETIEYFSDDLDQVYRLYVQLPPGYPEPGTRYPVLYALDGQVATDLYTNAVLPLIRRREIPEIIIVGIGHRGGRGLRLGGTLFDTRRVRDFTPVSDSTFTTAGQADTFLRFLDESVVPFIDATYQTHRDDRAIGGYELGGLFSCYAKLSDPDVFQRCLSIAPRFGRAEDYVFKIEADLAASDTPLDGQMYFVTFGDRSSTATVLADTMRSRRYPDLMIGDAAVSGGAEAGTVESAISDGLRFIYSQPSQS